MTINKNRTKKYSALLAIGLLSGNAFSQSLSNMTVVGPFKSTNTSAGANASAGIWGWTATNGQEYALLTSRTTGGTSIVSIGSAAAPTAPRELNFLPAGVNSIWHELMGYGNYVYKISQQGSVGLQIINMTPVQTGGNATILKTMALYNGNLTGHTVFVDSTTTPKRLYVTYGSAAGVAIYSLLDPTTPVLIGVIAGESHDMYGLGNRLFISTQRRGTVEIWDVTTPAIPMPTTARLGIINLTTRSRANGEIGAAATTIAHNAWPTADGKYLFTTEEIAGTYMKAWDVTNPATASTNGYLGRWVGVPGIIPHNGFINGRYLYVGHYTAGMYQVDILNIAAMRTVGWHTPRAINAGDLYGGTWGVYGWFPSRRFIHGDDTYGLYVLTPAAANADPTGVPTFPVSLAEDISLNALTITSMHRDEIRFQLPHSGGYSLSIFSPGGARLFNVRKQGISGMQSLSIGNNLAGGSYVARLEQNTEVLNRMVSLPK